MSSEDYRIINQNALYFLTFTVTDLCINGSVWKRGGAGLTQQVQW